MVWRLKMLEWKFWKRRKRSCLKRRLQNFTSSMKDLNTLINWLNSCQGNVVLISFEQSSNDCSQKTQTKSSNCRGAWRKALKWLLIKLPDSRSKFPCIQLWMNRRIWHCIKSRLRPNIPHTPSIIEPVMSAMIDFNSYHFQPAIIKTEWNSGSRYLFVFTNQWGAKVKPITSATLKMTQTKTKISHLLSD